MKRKSSQFVQLIGFILQILMRIHLIFREMDNDTIVVQMSLILLKFRIIKYYLFNSLEILISLVGSF